MGTGPRTRWIPEPIPISGWLRGRAPATLCFGEPVTANECSMSSRSTSPWTMRASPRNWWRFARGDIPFTAVLLIDASASMFGEKIEVGGCRGRVLHLMAWRSSIRPRSWSFQMSCSVQPRSQTPRRFWRRASAAPRRAEVRHCRTTSSSPWSSSLNAREDGWWSCFRTVSIPTALVSDAARFWGCPQEQCVLVYWIRISAAIAGHIPDRGVNMTSAWKDGAQYHEQRELLTQVVDESGGRIFRGWCTGGNSSSVHRHSEGTSRAVRARILPRRRNRATDAGTRSGLEWPAKMSRFALREDMWITDGKLFSRQRSQVSRQQSLSRQLIGGA